jgi:CBS domain-containing protein
MSLAEAVHGGQVGHLDLRGYITAEEEMAVMEVVRQMRRYDRTTVLVTREGKLTGIFTERDVLHKVITRPETWDRPVRDLMTRNPVVVGPDANILGALRLMTEGHFRDLPVVGKEGKILGNLTDNAVVRHLADRLQAEVLNLPPDPEQVPRTVEGA